MSTRLVVADELRQPHRITLNRKQVRYLMQRPATNRLRAPRPQGTVGAAGLRKGYFLIGVAIGGRYAICNLSHPQKKRRQP